MENELKNSSTIDIRTKGLLAVKGKGEGEIISTKIPLSFWGGINPSNGKIIDKYHPLSGSSITGKIFVLPKGRGSSTGSVVLLELILSNNEPSGIILCEKDKIIILGGIVAKEVFSREIPIIILNDNDFDRALDFSYAKIEESGYVNFTN